MKCKRCGKKEAMKISLLCSECQAEMRNAVSPKTSS